MSDDRARLAQLLPAFDPTWPADVREQWTECFKLAVAGAVLPKMFPKQAPKPNPSMVRDNMHLRTWRTDERDAVLRRMYPSAEPFYSTNEIMAELVKLPGEAIPQWSTISVAAIQRLHLVRGQKPPSVQKAKRSAGRHRKALAISETERILMASDNQAVTKAGTAMPPLARSWRIIKEMAKGHGWRLVSFARLGSYNRFRISKGLAPLAIKEEAVFDRGEYIARTKLLGAVVRRQLDVDEVMALNR